MFTVTGNRALEAVTLAMKAADRDLRRDINTATRQTMNPVWRDAVASRAGTRFERAMLNNGVRIAAGNPPVAKAAQSRRGLRPSRRLRPAESFPLAEFGTTKQDSTSTYTRRSKNGGTHRVTRRTRRGLPARNPRGRVVYPAFAEVAPRVVSLWVQLVVRKYHEASEAGGRG